MQEADWQNENPRCNKWINPASGLREQMFEVLPLARSFRSLIFAPQSEDCIKKYSDRIITEAHSGYRTTSQFSGMSSCGGNSPCAETCRDILNQRRVNGRPAEARLAGWSPFDSFPPR